MDFGTNWALLLIQIANIVLWFSISVTGLVALHRSGITRSNQVLWIILIIGIPLIGTLLFFIVQRFEKKKSESHQ
jgi:phage terminase large subunit-like protein